MSDSEKVSRKPPVEPLKVNNALYDRRGLSSFTVRRPDPVALVQAAALLERLCESYGRSCMAALPGTRSFSATRTEKWPFWEQKMSSQSRRRSVSFSNPSLTARPETERI